MNTVFVESANRVRFLIWYNDYHRTNLTMPELVTSRAGRNMRYAFKEAGWYFTFEDDMEAVHFKLCYQSIQIPAWD